MRKLLSATAVCAVAIGVTVAPGAMAKSGAKDVGGTVSVTPNPTTVTTGTTVEVSGNVASGSSCRKDRTVHFYYSGAPTTEVGTATTKPNGDYKTTLTGLPATTGETVLAKVDQSFRKFASKRKGKKTKKGRTAFNCLEITGASGPLTVS